MQRRERERFDALVEAQIDALPAKLRELLDEVPVIVEDEPSDEVLADFGLSREQADELCGLHTGVAFTDRSVEASGEMPSEIVLYRRGIIAEALDMDEEKGVEGGAGPSEDSLREQIRVTLLHEIGHQFGLDEDDLDRLGYA